MSVALIDNIYHNAERSYKTAFERFATILGESIGKKVEKQNSSFYDCFSLSDFIYAESLRSQTGDFPWYSIVISENAGQISNRTEALSVADSQQAAIGFVLDEIDTSRTKITNVTISENGAVSFISDEVLIAKIECLKFEKENKILARRIEKAFDGALFGYGHERLTRRLAKTHGFSNVFFKPNIRRWDISEITEACHKNPKNFRVALSHLMEYEYSTKLKISELQEMVAAVFDFQSWNHMVARKGDDICRWKPYMVSAGSGVTTYDERDIKYFRDMPQAMACFAEEMRKENFHGNIDTSRAIMGGFFTITEYNGDSEGWQCFAGPATDVECKHETGNAVLSMLNSPDPASMMMDYIGLNREDRLEKSSRRMGISPAHELWIGDWLFTVQKPENLSETWLSIEEFDPSHEFMVRQAIVSLHKTDIIKSLSGDGCYIVTEYQNETVLDLSGRTELEIVKLAALAGISICKGEAPAEKKPTRWYPLTG